MNNTLFSYNKDKLSRYLTSVVLVCSVVLFTASLSAPLTGQNRTTTTEVLLSQYQVEGSNSVSYDQVLNFQSVVSSLIKDDLGWSNAIHVYEENVAINLRLAVFNFISIKSNIRSLFTISQLARVDEDSMCSIRG